MKAIARSLVALLALFTVMSAAVAVHATQRAERAADALEHAGAEADLASLVRVSAARRRSDTRCCAENGEPIMQKPDYDTRAKSGGTLPHLDALTSETALLRRIAYNTDVIRLVLVWTAVIIPLIVLGVGIT